MRQRVTPLKQRLRFYAGRLCLKCHRHSVWVKLQRVEHGARDSLRSIVHYSVSTVPFESTLCLTLFPFARVFVPTNLFVVNLEDIVWILVVSSRFSSLCAPFLLSSLVPPARASVRVHPRVVLRRASFLPLSSANPSSPSSPSSPSRFDWTMPRHTSVTPSASSPYLTGFVVVALPRETRGRNGRLARRASNRVESSRDEPSRDESSRVESRSPARARTRASENQKSEREPEERGRVCTIYLLSVTILCE